MDQNTLEYLISCGIFSSTNYTKTFHDTIVQKEILMSRKIIEKGWNIGSLLPYYKNVDFTFSTKPPKAYKIKFIEDVMNNKYYGYLWNKQQLVFVKGNRNVNFEGSIIINNRKSNKQKIALHKTNLIRRQNVFRKKIFKKMNMHLKQ
jgi:hypothetical protein